MICLRTLMIAAASMIDVTGASMKQAIAQVKFVVLARRGGWADDPIWRRVEFCGLITVLILCGIGLAWNRIVQRRDREAHDVAEHFAEPDRVDEFLNGL